MLEHRRSTLSKYLRDFSHAEVISEVTGKVWGRSLSTGEQWDPWELRSFDQYMLAL